MTWSVRRETVASRLELSAARASGRTFEDYPITGMTPAGDVLLAAVDTATGGYEYYRLDVHDDLSLLLGPLSRDVTFPRLSDDGLLYFYLWDTGFYSLAVTPEPATVGLLALGATALLRRRRRGHRR